MSFSASPRASIRKKVFTLVSASVTGLILGLSLCLGTLPAEAGIADPARTIAIRFSEKTKVVQVLGRSMMDIATGDVSIRIDVPAKYVKFLSIGQPISVRSSSKPDVAYGTRVVEILPALGSNDTTRGVRLKPTQTMSDRLDVLRTADIPIPLEETGTRVPKSAVAFAGGRHYVIKVDASQKEGGKESAVPIQILAETLDSLSIRPLPGASIRDGDTILAERAIYSLPLLLEEKKN